LAEAAQQKTVVIYADETGHEPFTDWLEGLRDQQGRRRILTRLRRLEQGNYGDCKFLHGGVYELRMFFGPGYRVYFGEDDGNIVVLLCGGDKDSQDKNIKAAKYYWKEYRSHEKS
jgi:putative addiction module killer protein